VPAVPNTLQAINLEPEKLTGLGFPEFCKELLKKLAEVKNDRFGWYEQLRAKRSLWVNMSRRVLAICGAGAVLLTAVAAALRVILPPDSKYDVVALMVALVLYAAISAASFYEKATDNTTAYFRHLGVMLAIRDLWTKLQFEVLRQLRAVKPGDPASEAAVREQLMTLAQAFCADVDKLATGELTEWRTEFVQSLSELEEAARKGTEATQKQLSDAVKAIETASTAALKAAEEAAKPAYLNLKIEGTEGQVTILVDDTQVAATHLKSFPIKVQPGLRKIEARGKKGAADVQAAVLREVKAGPQDLTLALV
jgi:hypothetical protein